MLLLQQNNMCISKELLKYYIDLGFTKFCAGSIQQAKYSKEYNNIKLREEKYENINFHF